MGWEFLYITDDRGALNRNSPDKEMMYKLAQI